MTDQEPSFVIFVDPPGTVWETSTIGMLYGLKSMSDLINNLDETDDLAVPLPMIQSTLAVFCRQMLDRNGTAPDLEDEIRAIIKGKA